MIDKKMKTKEKILSLISGVLTFILVFAITFLIISVVIVGPEQSYKRISNYAKLFIGKLDTNVKITDNNITDDNQDIEKIKKNIAKAKLDEIKNANVKIPFDEIELPNFNERKYAEANRLYSEEDTEGLSNTWYYNQLDEPGKLIYRKLKNESGYFLEGTHVFDFEHAFNDLLNKENGQSILENAFQQSVNALMFDYPELFFINVRNITILIQKTSYIDKNIYSVSIKNAKDKTFFIDGLNTKEDVERARNLMEKIRYSVMEKITNPENAAEVALVAHDYIVDTVSYDRSLIKENIYNMYGALADREAVCEGYAKAFKYLLDYYKVPNIIVAGKGKNDEADTERHAWNYIKINGQWYGVDTTWDDPIIMTGNRKVTNELKYRYFLKGDKDFNKVHQADGEIVENSSFQYPQLSPYNYNY